MSEREEMNIDYEIQGLSTTYHPMRALGDRGSRKGVVGSGTLGEVGEGERVCCEGYVITRQRPMTAKGFSFLTLEDEEGMINVILRPDIYEKYRQVFRLEFLVGVGGEGPKEGWHHQYPRRAPVPFSPSLCRGGKDSTAGILPVLKSPSPLFVKEGAVRSTGGV